MPANLTPQYLEAEERYKKAKSIQDKISCLEEMLALMPKHKGTEKLQADLKKRLSKLRAMPEKKGAKSKIGEINSIKREGVGQVILIGTPNSGKSSLLTKITNQESLVASYPFTTRQPICGMMQYENILVEIVDMPPLTAESEGWIYNLIKNTDLVLTILDLEDLENQFTELKTLLGNYNIELIGKDKKTNIILCNKYDLDVDDLLFSEFKKIYKNDFDIINISCSTLFNIENLKEKIFKSLEIVRVYSKTPGKNAEKKSPFVAKSGTILIEWVEMIHKDFKDKFKFARVWNKNKLDGLRVPKDYVLQDEDIVEVHI